MERHYNVVPDGKLKKQLQNFVRTLLSQKKAGKMFLGLASGPLYPIVRGWMLKHNVRVRAREGSRLSGRFAAFELHHFLMERVRGGTAKLTDAGVQRAI